MKFIKISPHDALLKCQGIIQKYLPHDYLTIEIKKWKPLKTQKQLGLFFLALDYLCKKKGYTENQKEQIRKRIEKIFSFREKDMFGDLIPIPLSKCNRWEQFERFYDGLFALAGELDVDMADFIRQYEQLKREQK